MKKIMFTGGGTAGHVTVNLALIPHFQREGWDVVYVGSYTGIERQLVEQRGIRYLGIASGKLRRYFDMKNLSDPLRILRGTMQAVRIMKRERPSVLFSKGGFVSVPVVAAAWLCKVPAVIHESDLTPGLANRIAMRFAGTICTTFEESGKYLPAEKTQYVGAVVRDELDEGNAARGKAMCGFHSGKPILLVMGGSQGARSINEAVRSALDELLQLFQIVHLCGRGNLREDLKRQGYAQYEYLTDELPDALACADVVVSRAGSNSIFELLHLKKPMLLIPLTREQSRGDQILNARAFQSSGLCRVLDDDKMTPQTLVAEVAAVYSHRDELISRMANHRGQNAQQKLMKIIQDAARK